ncbi:hypothetical protein FQZ97_1039590 [compost metagenome]
MELGQQEGFGHFLRQAAEHGVNLLQGFEDHGAVFFRGREVFRAAGQHVEPGLFHLAAAPEVHEDIA